MKIQYHIIIYSVLFTALFYLIGFTAPECILFASFSALLLGLIQYSRV